MQTLQLSIQKSNFKRAFNDFLASFNVILAAGNTKKAASHKQPVFHRSPGSHRKWQQMMGSFQWITWRKNVGTSLNASRIKFSTFFVGMKTCINCISTILLVLVTFSLCMTATLFFFFSLFRKYLSGKMLEVAALQWSKETPITRGVVCRR